MHSLARRPDRLSFVAIVMVAMLSATVLFTVASLSSPSIALGASVHAASCDDVALRTRPSVASRRMAVIDSGKQVSVVSTVKGGSWTVTCAGTDDLGKHLVPDQCRDGAEGVRALRGHVSLYRLGAPVARESCQPLQRLPDRRAADEAVELGDP